MKSVYKKNNFPKQKSRGGPISMEGRDQSLPTKVPGSYMTHPSTGDKAYEAGAGTKPVVGKLGA